MFKVKHFKRKMIEIHTAVVNNPTFIELQYITCKKFIHGDFVLKVFNDAKEFSDFTNNGDVTIKKQIRDICEKLNIECIDIPNQHHIANRSNYQAAQRCEDSMQYMLHNYHLKNDKKYLVLDSDMFIISEFNVDKYKEYDLAIVPQNRNDYNLPFSTNYFWNGLYYFDMKNIDRKDLFDWKCITKDNSFNADVGTAMRDFLLETKNNIYSIKHHSSGTWCEKDLHSHLNKTLLNFLNNDPRNIDGNFFAELYDETFLHYRAGGNWDNVGKTMHDNRTQLLQRMIYDICKS